MVAVTCAMREEETQDPRDARSPNRTYRSNTVAVFGTTFSEKVEFFYANSLKMVPVSPNASQYSHLEMSNARGSCEAAAAHLELQDLAGRQPHVVDTYRRVAAHLRFVSSFRHHRRGKDWCSPFKLPKMVPISPDASYM